MNPTHKSIYIGVTNNLERRIYEHKNKLIKGFSEKYNLCKLVYFEECSQIDDALLREKQLKNWHRDWKLNLIKQVNPQLIDLDAEMSALALRTKFSMTIL